MKYSLSNSKNYTNQEITLIGAYQDSKTNLNFVVNKLPKDFQGQLKNLNTLKSFKASLGEMREITHDDSRYIFLGLGDKKSLTREKLRRNLAKALKSLKNIETIEVDIDSFVGKTNALLTIETFIEVGELSHYTFSKYKSSSKETKEISYLLKCSSVRSAQFKKSLETQKAITSSMNYCRDLVNEAPNVLHSEKYAELIEKDVKESFKGKNVKLKILKKSDIKKEKMNLFLSVNSGSAYEPRLVHLTYTPKKSTSKTKHIALVGKGITFDTGGYSLKPSRSMIGMKFDMGGSATVYGAFRAAVLSNSPNKVTCVLAITDNAVNSKATMPDSIVKGRNGKTVEILNTDAEGRLILADALDYTCDLKPDEIIDAATLTGACLVTFGSEVCALLGNDSKLSQRLLKSAKKQDEYLWELPIIDEFRGHMKSKIADLKNIGPAGKAGTATAAAFLENFIKDDIPWAHLDIAGVCDSQSHLPYCPPTGASGIMVRSLCDYLCTK